MMAFAGKFPFHRNILGQGSDEVPMERQQTGSTLPDLKRMESKSLQKPHYQNYLGCFPRYGHVVYMEGEEC